MRNLLYVVVALIALPHGGCHYANSGKVANTPPPTATETVFGHLPDGRPVKLFTLTNGSGTRISIMERGATITGLWTPDRHGTLTRVIMGADSLPEYLSGFGAAAAVIGRYANRIQYGRFTLDGTTHQLITNCGPHFLHGGKKSFAAALWQGTLLPTQAASAAVTLRYHSAAGDDGFPGNLLVSVTYTLTNDNQLRIAYQAQCDQPTPINLTNHAYFNLGGHGHIHDTLVWINADRTTAVDELLIPTGAYLPLSGTPLDFTTPHTIGASLAHLKPPFTGYDHNYILRSSSTNLPLVAWAHDAPTGRTLKVYTDQPALQFYIGKRKLPTLDTPPHATNRFNTFCFETQHFPDSPNHPHFPSTILRPGNTFNSTTIYHFSTTPPPTL